MKIFRIESGNNRLQIEGAQRIGLKFIPCEGKSTDSIIHDWVIQNLSGKEADLIFVPIAIDAYHTNFLGLLLGLHIRMTPELGSISRCPIVFYSYVPLEIICRISENYHLIFSKGSRFLRIGIDNPVTYLADHFVPLSDEQYESFLEKNEVKAPQSFHDDNHSVANIWGVHILNQISNVDLQIKNEYTKYLYFKWLALKYKILSNNTPILRETKDLFLAGKKLALIDDEYEKGWSEVLTKIIEKYGGLLVVFNDFKDINKNNISARVERFVESNPDIDIYLVDLRLFEDDHKADIKPVEITGFEVIKIIKSVNGGNQVMAFTASNKIWNLDVARRSGADGYYIKEAPETTTAEMAHENYTKFISELKRLKSRADKLKPLWDNLKWVKTNLYFSPSPTRPSNNSTDSEVLVKEEYKFLFETVNRIEEVLTPEKQQLRYCILLLVKILEILSGEYVVNKVVSPMRFKNRDQLNFYDKSNNIYYVSAQINPTAYKSLANIIRAIDYQLFRRNNPTAHIQIEMLIKKRNDLIHKPDDYTLNLNDILKWQKLVFDLLQAVSRFRW